MLVPLRDRVLVIRVNGKGPAELNKGGVIVPGLKDNKSNEAKVVALGSGRLSTSGSKIPFDVKVGDLVLLNKYSGVEIQIDNIHYVLVREEDILCILKGN
jgi:chaperonin GroES